MPVGLLFFLKSDSAKWLDYRTSDTRQQDSVVGDIRNAGKIFLLKSSVHIHIISVEMFSFAINTL